MVPNDRNNCHLVIFHWDLISETSSRCENVAQQNHHRHRNSQSSIGLADPLTQNDHGAGAVMYLRPSPTYKLSHPTVLNIAVPQTHNLTQTHMRTVAHNTHTYTHRGYNPTCNLLHTTVLHIAVLKNIK